MILVGLVGTECTKISCGLIYQILLEVKFLSRRILSRQNLQRFFKLDIDALFGRARSKICSRSTFKDWLINLKSSHEIQVQDDFFEKNKEYLETQTNPAKTSKT